LPRFSQTETDIQNLFNIEEDITFNGTTYKVTTVAKPTSSSGEPKTDVYIALKNDTDRQEIKISIKQANADFIENKIKAERAEEYFGTNWAEIVMQSTSSIRNKFEEKILIYKEKQGRVEKGCITLGWKFEFLNKSGGDLSGVIDVNLAEAYKGVSLDDDKKNALVNGVRINNSGIAEYILLVDDTASYSNGQDVLDSLVSIDDYIIANPILYFACKALNYRSLKNPAKWDGNRPLAVYVDWTVENGKLKHEIKYDVPLTTKGNSVAIRLQESLASLGIVNTNHLSTSNVVDCSICN